MQGRETDNNAEQSGATGAPTGRPSSAAATNEAQSLLPWVIGAAVIVIVVVATAIIVWIAGGDNPPGGVDTGGAGGYTQDSQAAGDTPQAVTNLATGNYVSNSGLQSPQCAVSWDAPSSGPAPTSYLLNYFVITNGALGLAPTYSVTILATALSMQYTLGNEASTQLPYGYDVNVVVTPVDSRHRHLHRDHHCGKRAVHAVATHHQRVVRPPELQQDAVHPGQW
jgi:hypothetical protein